MRILWISMMSLILTCCVSSKKNNSLSIKIDDAQSYSYDLDKRHFIIHFISKPDSIIQFQLSDLELKSIVDKYYELELNEINSKVKYEDVCGEEPSLFTRIQVLNKTASQDISIETGCGKFAPAEAKQAGIVLKFLRHLNSILLEKPEIKNNQVSDYYYK